MNHKRNPLPTADMTSHSTSLPRSAFRLVWGLVALSLFTSVPTSGSLCSAETKAEFVRSLLALYETKMGVKPTNPVTVSDHGSWIEAADANYVFRIDTHQKQSIRPRNLTSALSLELERATAYQTYRVRPPASILDQMESRTRGLLRDLANPEQEPLKLNTLNNILIKKEVVFLRTSGGIKCIDSRYLVRLWSWDHYFQVFFDAALKPIRIDTSLQVAETETISNLILDSSLKPLKEPGALSGLGPIRFGAFYARGEHRFEVGARSFLGEEFIDHSVRENPWQKDDFDLTHTEFVDVDAYRRSSDYHFWCYRWWENFGRVGAAKGNYEPTTKAWQNPDVQALIKPLSQYTFVAGEPTAVNKLRLSDGKEYEFPFATDQVMEQRFRQDLESCTIAVFLAHGGSIHDALQFGRAKDTWFKLCESDPTMGSGALRHLFFDSCSTMDVFRGKYSPLLTEFLPATHAQGIRTICGIDGVSIGLGRSGWQFFGHYNQGDSIADAWALSKIDECPSNSPVTVAYGASPSEALETLLKGRFSASRSATTSCCAGVWVNLVGDDSVK